MNRRDYFKAMLAAWLGRHEWLPMLSVVMSGDAQIQAGRALMKLGEELRKIAKVPSGRFVRGSIRCEAKGSGLAYTWRLPKQ